MGAIRGSLQARGHACEAGKPPDDLQPLQDVLRFFFFGIETQRPVSDLKMGVAHLISSEMLPSS